MSNMRLAILASHPIQYQAPLFRAISRQPDVELQVLFCHDHGVKPTLDPGFGKIFQYDVPLLEGYRSRFLTNYARRPSLRPTGMANAEIVTVVARGGFDAVLVQGYTSLTSLMALATPRRGTRLLFRGESNLDAERTLGLRAAKQLGLRALFSRVDHFVAIGKLNAEYFQHYGVPAAKISIAPYSVDNAYFAERARETAKNRAAVRAKLGLPERGVVFLFVAKVYGIKRPLDLLAAFEKSCRDGGQGTLCFVGEGQLSAELDRRVEASAFKDRVRVLGFRNQSELPEIYAASDVLVLPSEHEPWGLVVNEALASGMTAVTSQKVGSAPDLVEPECVFPVGDTEKLASILRALGGDPARVEELKVIAQRKIQRWDIAHTAAAIVSAARTPSARSGTTARPSGAAEP
jgi:glycosyltransferase involved in cell wall biosynthesis